MNNPLISVVIPFYKGDQYIWKSVKSILKQPFQRIEVILVNDGSPSGNDICRQIVKSDSRVKYYIKENEGIGATRNYGIKQATGKYIAFLDQDDVWCNNFLDGDTIQIIETKKDIFAFSYYNANENLSRGGRVQIKNGVYNGKEARYCCWRHHSSMFFRREFILKNQIEYALTRHEDLIFLQKALYLAKEVQCVNKAMFLYRNNPYSETHSSKRPDMLYVPLLQSWLSLLQWFEFNDPMDKAIINSTKNMICVYGLEGIEEMYRYGMSDIEIDQIVKLKYPIKILFEYQSVMDEGHKKELLQEYICNHKQFFKREQRRRIKCFFLCTIKKIPGVKYIRDRRKYPDIIKKLYNVDK